MNFNFLVITLPCGSLTLLMHMVAKVHPIDLHNFSVVVSFLGARKLAHLECTTMPELRRMPTQFRLLPNLCLGVSYFTAMILLFLDLKGALLKINQ